MKLKLTVKKSKRSDKKKIIAWIQKSRDFNTDVQQAFQFFQDKIIFLKKSKFLRYHVVTSDNPAIILSLFTTIQDLIPDIYFNGEDSIEI